MNNDLGQRVQHQQPLCPRGQPRVPHLVPEVGQQLVHLDIITIITITNIIIIIITIPLLTWLGSTDSPAAWAQISFSAGRMSRVGSVNLK